MDQDSLDQIQKLLEAEIGMVKNLQQQRKPPNSKKSQPKPTKKSPNTSNMRRTQSFHTTKVRDNNRLASDYVKYVPAFQQDLKANTLDEFLNQNDICESLISNFGHYADPPQPITEKLQTTQTTARTYDDPQCSFRPMLLRKSLVIAEKLGDPIQRLTKPKEAIPTAQQYSFKPTVNKYPRCNSNSGPRWKQLYDQSKSRRNLQTQMQPEEESHSFQPDISMSQNSVFANVSDMSIVDRNHCWQQRKQQRIAQKAQEIEREKIQQCSFRPSIKRTSTSPLHPNVISDFGKKGWVEFFERVAKKHKPPPVVQSKWKNQLTRPIEPKVLSRNKSYCSSKENIGVMANTSILNQMAPEIKHLRRELQDWNF